MKQSSTDTAGLPIKQIVEEADWYARVDANAGLAFHLAKYWTQIRAALIPDVAATPWTAEQIARTIALSYGRDPDELTSIGEMCDADNQPVAVWCVYEEQAEAILTAYFQRGFGAA